ncbi:hypothetical protein BDA96_10G206700 [Sorghum bicolor]|nr:hypothetical protein BDA96_10G206700 [Sorghum bicolor]
MKIPGVAVSTTVAPQATRPSGLKLGVLACLPAADSPPVSLSEVRSMCSAAVNSDGKEASLFLLHWTNGGSTPKIDKHGCMSDRRWTDLRDDSTVKTTSCPCRSEI